ncbi:MAG: cofactor-independent phosphoglycerate mutase [Nitrospinae bacterium]|nr:cofactor-independent phosphoglycerate mutase [Nitrospinota bacterium]
MKYIILLGDGMPDYPIKELGDKTPLEYAKTPNMDFIAKNGTVGCVKTIPDGFPPGSDVSNLSILGYDPEKYYTGRAPLEAASIGVKLSPTDVAFRCNLVTLKPTDSELIMEDFSAGHISTEEARELISAIDKKLGTDEIKFYPGVSYRHLMVWKNGSSNLKLTPPHDISGKNIKSYISQGDRANILTELMNSSQMVLSNHKINKERKNNGKNPANSIWLWGHGKAPAMPTLKERFNLTGSIIAAVDLMKGIGIYAGLTPIDVPGATGYIDTNYEGKADYALKELENKDFVYLHVEAPDEAAHNGSLKNKIKAIEDFDKRVVGRILEGIKKFKEYRIMVVSDHPSPISIKTHSSERVPFAIYPAKGGSGVSNFNEKIVSNPSIKFEKGHELIEFFIN